MTQADRQWEILGYDTRRVGKSVVSAWRDLLWGNESPIKLHLDEAVRLSSPAGERIVQSARELPSGDPACEGILLPDELVLCRILRVPRAAEVDLPAVMELEVNANNPFPIDDVACGWKVIARDEQNLQVCLAIVSTSAVMTYLASEYDIHDPREREVWAEFNGELLPLRGFGEGRRLQRYQSRLLRVGGMAAGCLLLLLFIAGLAAGGKYLERRQLEEHAERVIEESREASRIREQLATANETIDAVNRIVNDYPNPHIELERLTRLLDDEAYLAQLSMRGRAIKLRGRAMDGAAVMQILTDEEAYAEVTAPQAIVRVADTGLQQFYLNITLRGGEPE